MHFLTHVALSFLFKLRLVGALATWVTARHDLTMAVAAFARLTIVPFHNWFVWLGGHTRGLDAIDIDSLLDLLIEHDDLSLVLWVDRTLITVLSSHAMV